MSKIEEYNKLILNINKAEKFIIEHQKDAKIFDYMAKFMKAMEKANVLIAGIEKELGREMTNQEVLEGIK